MIRSRVRLTYAEVNMTLKDLVNAELPLNRKERFFYWNSIPDVGVSGQLQVDQLKLVELRARITNGKVRLRR